jgi:aspartate aminotransferase-like enzyme
VREGLKKLFQTNEEVLMLASTGTGAMDATVSNLFSPGDTVITVNAGKFGQRWTKIAQAYGLRAVELTLEPGRAPQISQIETLLRAHPESRAVLFQASETSTGVQLPTREICELVRRQPGCLAVVDAITALGVFDLPMDAWGIDVLITGSQKALMLPPGMACIALSQRAWEAQSRSRLPKFYFDLAREHKAHLKNQTAWTPATAQIIGLQESLRLIHEEGLQNIFARHARLALATREGVKALGLDILANDSPSTAVTAVRVPAEILDGKRIPRTMRDKHGVIIAGGQDELEGKIFRLSHFGYVGPFDVITGLAALEMTLFELGYKKFEFGDATGAALRVFSENP